MAPPSWRVVTTSRRLHRNWSLRGNQAFSDGRTSGIPREEQAMSDFGDKALGKSMAKAAAIGAVVAIPIPFVGPIIGAAAGAGYAYYKNKKRT
jgi:hypothetical protein